MKKLPDHSPKASAWEDLLKKGTFESQLDNHLPTLPQFAPQDAVWEKITAELDQKKVIPIWLKWSAAAAVVAVLLLSALSLNKPNGEIKNQELVAEHSTETESKKAEVDPNESSSIAETIVLNPENGTNRPTPKKKVNRTIEIIEAPKITLPEIELWQSNNLSLDFPKTKAPETQIQKTLHQVSVTWSKLKPGLQVKTSFGRMESELGQKREASIRGTEPLTVVGDIPKKDLH